MHRVSPLHLLPALLAAGALITLLPAGASGAPARALSPALSQAVSAVPAPPPWQAGGDAAGGYRTLSRLLEGQGLSQTQIRLAYLRLGETALDRLEAGELTVRELEVLSLDNSRQELAERYLDCARANPELTPEAVVLRVNMGLDRPFYEDPAQVEEYSTLMLVNKYNALPEDYDPSLVKLSDLGSLGSGSLAPEAAYAFQAMAQAAEEEDVTLRSVSAYRSYSTQRSTYNRFRSQYSQSFTDSISARPGYSEHQTGLALDINSASLLDHFEDTEAYAWLQDNCASFGFLLRYPEGAEDITGYRFEPWHYRYVGKEAARACMEGGLTLEEYLAAQPSGWGAAPRVTWGGQTLELKAEPMLLEGGWYLPVEETALALGWQREEDGALTLEGRRVECSAGLRCRVDGVILRFTAPAVELDGRVYLPAGDLCRALGVELEAGPEELALTAGEEPG